MSDTHTQPEPMQFLDDTVQQSPEHHPTISPETAEQPPVDDLEAQVIAAVKTVYDPEIPVDIYELGLIYQLTVDEARGHVDVEMTLTAPGCPVAEYMPGWVQEAIEGVAEINTCQVELVWDPPWQPDLMSMRAKLELNMF